MTNRIIINKSNISGSKSLEFSPEQVDMEQYRALYEKRYVTKVSELKPESPFSPGRSEEGLSRDEQLIDMYANYDKFKTLLSQQEILDFKNHINLDLIVSGTIDVNGEAVEIPEGGDIGDGIIIPPAGGDQGSQGGGSQGGTLNMGAGSYMYFPRNSLGLILSDYEQAGTKTAKLSLPSSEDVNQFWSMMIYPTRLPINEGSHNFIVRYHSPKELSDLNIYSALSELYISHNNELTFHERMITETGNDSREFRVTSTKPLKLNAWNYVYWGWKDWEYQVIDIINDDNPTYDPTVILQSAMGTRTFRPRDSIMANVWASTGESGPIIDELYLKYPQLTIGGIDLEDDTGRLGSIELDTINNTTPNLEKLLFSDQKWNYRLADGFSDFYLASFRFYDDWLDEVDLTLDIATKNITNVNQLLNKCNMSLDFTKMADGKVQGDDINGHWCNLTGDFWPRVTEAGEHQLSTIVPELREL